MENHYQTHLNKPLIILWIRRDKNYYLHDKIRGYSWMGSITGIKESMPVFKRRVEKIKIWNKTFKIPYIDFRKGLRKISEEFLKSLPVDIVFFYEDSDHFMSIPDDSWIFPIDEDDWLDPNIFMHFCKNIKLFSSKNLVYYNILQKVLDGKILNRHVGAYEEASFGYFIKTPCPYSSVSSFFFSEEFKNNESSLHIPMNIGLKIDSISSLSVLQAYRFHEIIRLGKKDLNEMNMIKGYEKPLTKYWYLLAKVLKDV